MKYDGKNIDFTPDHQCPFCKRPLMFYCYKRGRKFVWWHCIYCNFDTRIKKSDLKTNPTYKKSYG